jgi:hypothetical protein
MSLDSVFFSISSTLRQVNSSLNHPVLLYACLLIKFHLCFSLCSPCCSVVCITILHVLSHFDLLLFTDRLSQWLCKKNVDMPSNSDNNGPTSALRCCHGHLFLPVTIPSTHPELLFICIISTDASVILGPMVGQLRWLYPYTGGTLISRLLLHDNLSLVTKHQLFFSLLRQLLYSIKVDLLHM